LVTGCFTSPVVDDALTFNRVPEPLAERYRAAEGSRVRLECPSMVRLRFTTRATLVNLALRYGAAARQFFQGVVRHAGADMPFGPTAATPEWTGTAWQRPGNALTLAELWLPHLVRTDLLWLETDAPLTPAPHPVRHWLALGDSITQGMTVPLPTQAWVAQVATTLGLDVRSFGIGGARLEACLGEQSIPWAYDLLTIAYGTNDFNGGVPLEQVATHTRALCARQRAEHPRAAIALITAPPWATRTTPNNLGLQLADYRRVMAEAAATVPGITVIAGDQLLPDDASLFVDNVHPNEAGMKCYAEALIPHLRPLLSR
jgi:lysophospholipase L1-like esterase